MFKCEKCGIVRRGTKEFKIPKEIREVTYLIQIKYLQTFLDNSQGDTSVELKTVARHTGFEIVKESSYCKKHLPKNFKPSIKENIIRKNTIATKRVIVKREHRSKNGKTRRHN